MNLVQQALKALGVGWDVSGFLPKLEKALEKFTDEVRREAEFAFALAEMRAGRVPTIVKNFIEDVTP